jgi:MFS family permease
MAFINGATVLPTFVRRLTDSTVLIGLASTIQTGGWLLPQLIAARYVRGQTQAKRFVIIPALIGRPALWMAAIATAVFGISNPAIALAIFFLGLGLFWICDGLASLPWFDLLAKTITPARVGKVIGVSQAIYGIIALGVSRTVAYVLSPDSPLSFPHDYALLFGLGGLAFMLSLLALTLIREPAKNAAHESTTEGGYLELLSSIFFRDRAFRTLVIARLLVGYSAMAQPFYIVYATEIVGLSPETIGSFILAQTVGGILGGLALGYLNDKRGCVAVVLASICLTLAMPVIALLAPVISGGSEVHMFYAYLLIFAVIGIVNSSFMLGFIPRLMEIAPDAERPVYMGLANTLNALSLIAPLIGGWIVQTAEFPALFAISIGFAVLAVSLGPRIIAHRSTSLSE